MHGYKRWPESDRRKTQDPEAILTKAGLRPGMTFADIGCGQGYFAIPAARLVGAKGKVYGIDLDGEAIDVLKKNASAGGLDNIRAEVGDAERKTICRACADVAFFGICLHDFENVEAALRNARRTLKPGGTLADLDWKMIRDPAGGPPCGARLGEKKASKLIEEAGFTVKSVEDIEGRYYMIIAEAPRPTRR
jgi:ubiquinone/menaquinone biosynthesis C-methylase UbiE